MPLNFQQPAPHLLHINPYLISNQYGLIDLPKEILSSINGKDVIDVGGLKETLHTFFIICFQILLSMFMNQFHSISKY